MPGSITGLYELCEEYLDACETAVGLTLAGAIGRVFVSPGPPAWDCCPQLTVHAGGPTQGDTAPLNPPLQPGHRPEAGMVNLISMTATVLRCVPTFDEQTGQFPDPLEIDAAAQAVLADVWAVWNHLVTLKTRGQIFVGDDGDAKQREMFLDPAVAVNIAGGCAGWQIPIRVRLDGFRTS